MRMLYDLHEPSVDTCSYKLTSTCSFPSTPDRPSPDGFYFYATQASIRNGAGQSQDVPFQGLPAYPTWTADPKRLQPLLWLHSVPGLRVSKSFTTSPTKHTADFKQQRPKCHLR